MNRARLVGLLLACGLFCLPAIPAAAQYPPSAATVEVSATTLVPGESLTITGEGWLPNSEVEISIFSPLRALGSVMTDGAGRFSITVTIPEDLPPGRYTLRLTGLGADGEPRTVDIPLLLQAPTSADDGEPSVVAAPAAPADTAGDAGAAALIREVLAATGLDAGVLAMLGVAAFLIGAGLVFVVRKRAGPGNVA